MKTLTSLVTLALLLLCLSSDAAFYQYQFATTNEATTVTNIIKEISGTVIVGGTAQWNTNASGTGVTNTFSGAAFTIANSGTLTLSGAAGLSVAGGINAGASSVTAGGFSGPGPLLTGLNASQLISGTVPLTQLPSPIITQTNFLSGVLYNNASGRPLTVKATAVLTAAAVSGNSTLELRVGIVGTTTNYVTTQTGAAVITGADKYPIMIDVPIGASYTFTNTSSGAGNSATVSGGQIIAY